MAKRRCKHGRRKDGKCRKRKKSSSLGSSRDVGCTIPAYSRKMADVRRCARECGSKWFSAGAMRFFDSRVGRTAYADGRGGAYFVSSEAFKPGQRRWTVRRYNPTTCSIDTVGKFQRYRSANAATSVAKRIAAKSRTRKR